MKKNIIWLGVLAILIINFGTIYAVVIHAQRSDANYPQIQIAEDAAGALNQNAKPDSLVGSKVNMLTSLDPFTIIYNRSGKVVAGSGYLNGSLPTVPLGVLQASNGKTYNFVTWQPENGVRVAAVSVSANNYYVLSGRSLKEVENNENGTFLFSFTGGVLSVVVLGAAYIISDQKKR